MPNKKPLQALFVGSAPSKQLLQPLFAGIGEARTQKRGATQGAGWALGALFGEFASLGRDWRLNLCMVDLRAMENIARKPLIFRVMTRAADGGPEVGSTSSKLGVRIHDPSRPDKKSDIAADSQGQVHPKTGGMSVNPSLETLPDFLVPRRLNGRIRGADGPERNHCWKMGHAGFAAGAMTKNLAFRPEQADHGLVEPINPLSAAAFQDALADTKAQWVIDEGE